MGALRRKSRALRSRGFRAALSLIALKNGPIQFAQHRPLRQPLKLNPFDLADCDLVFGPVVELRGPGRFMRSHLLGMLEPASIRSARLPTPWPIAPSPSTAS